VQHFHITKEDYPYTGYKTILCCKFHEETKRYEVDKLKVEGGIIDGRVLRGIAIQRILREHLKNRTW
jgi:hypothetical protein